MKQGEQSQGDGKASKTQILVDQGWTSDGDGYWIPPTSHTPFIEDKAIQIANHPDFRAIILLMG